MGSPDKDGTPVASQIEDPVGAGHAKTLGSEIVVIDWHRLLAPDPARVFEVADQFLLLGVHTNDGQFATTEAPSLPSDAVELLVSLFGRDGERLDVGVQGVVDFMQKPAHGIGADVDL